MPFGLADQAVEQADIGDGERAVEHAYGGEFQVLAQFAEVDPVLEAAVGDGAKRLDGVAERLWLFGFSFSANARRRSRCF